MRDQNTTKQKMKIPKQISPDNLKDTIVQVLFKPKVAPELILGAFHHYFKDTYDFYSSTSQKHEIQTSGKIAPSFEFVEEGYFLNKTEEVKIKLSSKGIVFNTYKDYIGWDKYFPEIKSTIDKLFKDGLIESVQRVGIRYISQFNEVNLEESFNVKIDISLQGREYMKRGNTQIRNEFIEENFKTILTLYHGYLNDNNQETKEALTSIIDIDTIQYLSDTDKPDKVIDRIDKGHTKQKETFFSLLRPAFLETLNPEY